jgi:hypothetical protein
MYMLRFSLLFSPPIRGWIVTSVTTYNSVHGEREGKRGKKREKVNEYCCSTKQLSSSLGKVCCPWSEVKSRRGAPKRIDTEGFACPNPKCSYFANTDA